MSTLGLETLLVGDILDGVEDTIKTGVGELTADFKSLILRSSVLDFTIFGDGDTVRCFYTVRGRK